MDHLLTAAQAAERLGTQERYVRRLIAERRIRFYRVGRYVRLDPADLDEFVASGAVEPIVVVWRRGRLVPR